VTKPAGIPDTYLDPVDPAAFLAACQHPNQLIYFLLNVGDGDTQLVLLPSINEEPRRGIVVDVCGGQRVPQEVREKLPVLVSSLQAAGLLRDPRVDTRTPHYRRTFPLVVGTHPHDDHIGAMPDFLEMFAADVAEYWDPGFYHPTAAFIDTMRQLEANPHIVWTQPSSGTRRYVDDTRITVLAPGIPLKQRYDSYGVDPNNASITLKLEYPYRRVQERTARVADEAVSRDDRLEGRLYAKTPRVRSLILGGDAQSLSWAQVEVDFPKLESKHSPIYDALKMARGVDPLSTTVFKVSHHASKRGVHHELVETLDPQISLVSSVGGGGSYGFPHRIAQDAIREVRQKLATKDDATQAAERKADYDLGIYYTADTVHNPTEDPHGTIAVIVPTYGPGDDHRIQVWRFGDADDEHIDLNQARHLHPEPVH
jgi:hypothetical protein